MINSFVNKLWRKRNAPAEPEVVERPMVEPTLCQQISEGLWRELKADRVSIHLDDTKDRIVVCVDWPDGSMTKDLRFKPMLLAHLGVEKFVASVAGYVLWKRREK